MTDPKKSAEAMTSPLSPSVDHCGPRFLPADVIANRFEVVRFIARGGMGEVYEVKDRFLQGVILLSRLSGPKSPPMPAVQPALSKR
jgi:serine/threonine protein kinase